MTSLRKAMWLTALVLVSCAVPVAEHRDSSPPASPEGGNLLSKERYQRLRRAVYEVVVPKLEDEATRYERPLPFDKLPFRQRNDKFHGLGTAFCLKGPDGRKEIVSAAHVFAIQLETLKTLFQLRDTEGNLHPIKHVTRYSNYRDLVALETESTPDDAACLDAAASVDVGDVVFNVGNAQGEGISYRGGQLASFTPEEIAGRWRFLRFSAPASPGNSGGPLLNAKGEVVGIVTRKNHTENLNYAVPVDEVFKLSTTKAELYYRRSTLRDGTRLVEGDWEFSESLPATLAALAPPARASLRAFSDSLRKRLVAESEAKHFPENPRFREYLTRQVFSIRGLGHVKSDANDLNWTVEAPSFKRVEIGPDQAVRFSARRDGYADVLVDKPRGMTLDAYWRAPARVMEDILKATDAERVFAGDRIRILSYGPPKAESRWKDRLGRPWRSSAWMLVSSDEYVGNECTLVPGGQVCLNVQVPMQEWGAGYLDGLRREIDKIQIPYTGTVREWQEFLASDEGNLPSFLAEAKIEHEPGKPFFLHAGELTIETSFPEITAESRVTVEMGYDPTERLGSLVLGLEIAPEETRRLVYGVHLTFAPAPGSSRPHRERWRAVLAKRTPFDGTTVLRNELRQVNLVLDAKRGITTDEPQGTVRYVAYCGDNAGDDVVLKARCQRFAAGVGIAR